MQSFCGAKKAEPPSQLQTWTGRFCFCLHWNVPGSRNSYPTYELQVQKKLSESSVQFIFAFTACQAQLFVNLHTSFIVLSCKDNFYPCFLWHCSLWRRQCRPRSHPNLYQELGRPGKVLKWVLWWKSRLVFTLKAVNGTNLQRWPLWMLLNWSLVGHPGLYLWTSVQLCSMKFPI